VNDKQKAVLYGRMKIWLGFWLIAAFCGLPLFDHATLFWVSVFSAAYVAKWGAR
jgi:hypothetical protein